MNEVKPAWVMLASVLAGAAVAFVLWHRGPAEPPARRPAPAAPVEAAPRAAPWVGSERLAGLVEDDEGKPVSGALVTAGPVDVDGSDDGARGTRSASARSDAGGRFEFTGLPAGALQLEASAPLHERAVLPALTLPVPAGADPLRVVLARTTELSGEVLDLDGRPAAGASVTIAGSGLWPPKTLTADGAGRFRLTPLAGGVYELRASTGSMTSDPREGITVEPGREAFVSIALIEGITLRGRVQDAETGRPVEGARVTVREDALTALPRELLTDAAGRFELPGLRPLAHRIAIHADGFVALSGESRLSQLPTDKAQAFPMRRAGVLRGTVVDAAGDPVEGAELEVLGTTDVGGDLHLSPAALRFQRDLFATRLGNADAAGPGNPATGATGDNLGVTRGAVPRIPLVSGTQVREAAAGPGADEESVLALRTDARGEFRIEGVPPGRVQVLARRPGYVVARSAIRELQSGGTIEAMHVKLSRGGELVGRVLDGRGFPVETARIQLDLEGEPYGRVALSATDGRFGFGAVLGRCTVTAHRPGSPPVREVVQVPIGEVVRVDLVFGDEARELTGRVLGPRGFPVAGAILSLEAVDTRTPLSRTTTSETDGTFVFRGLPAPPYRLRTEHSSFAPDELRVAEAGTKGIRIELQPGARLRGRVSDAFHDRPLTGVRLELVTVDANERHTARSDTQGVFEFRNLGAGNYVLIAKKESFVPVEVAVALEGDLEVDALELMPAGTISGEVVDRFGTPVFNAEIAIGDPPRWGVRGDAARTDHAGRFELPGLPDGEHRVSARHRWAGQSERAVPVRVYTLQETPGLVLRLPADAQSSEDAVADPQEPGAGAQAVEREGVAVRLGFRAGAVTLEAVAPDSRARAAGLRAGDRLLAVDGEAVHAASQARAMLVGAAGTTVVLDVKRGARTQRLLVTRERHVPP